MICEKCGNEIDTIGINIFMYDGSDKIHNFPFMEEENNAVVIETDKSWTGYELDEEELPDTIECPICHQFPFKDKEVQVYEPVVIVCFKEKDKEEIGYSICSKKSGNSTKFSFGDRVKLGSKEAVVVNVWDLERCVGKQNYTIYLKDENKSITCSEDELEIL